MSDMVNSPDHYNQGDIECIVAIAATMSTEAFEGFLSGQVLKYVWRYKDKGKPEEDLKKAKYYLERLIECRES